MYLFNPIIKFGIGKKSREGGRKVKVRVSPNNTAFIRRPAEKGLLVENY